MIEFFFPFLTRFKVYIRKGAISGPVVQPLTLSQQDKDKCISVLKRQIQKQKNKQSSPTKIVENPLNRKAWIKETFFSASFWACHYFIATVLTKISVRQTFSVIRSYRTTALDPLLQISQVLLPFLSKQGRRNIKNLGGSTTGIICLPWLE